MVRGRGFEPQFTGTYNPVTCYSEVQIEEFFIEVKA